MPKMTPPPFIWFNGSTMPWDDARVHVMTHALHYGSSVFEGIRVYETPDGPRGFRITDHLNRLHDSAKIYRMPVPYTVDELLTACGGLVAANELPSAYIRPIVFRGAGTLGVAPTPETPVEVAVAAVKWGAYLGEEAMANGVDVCMSSWQRYAPNTLPAMAKAGGNYLSGQLIAEEAHRLGFSEGIALSSNGMLSEGSGENLFVVRDGKIYTPPAGASILYGITRDTVFKLAADEGIEVIEQDMPRELLYLADEIFFTGTAAEITPVRSVDRINVRSEGRGPITKRLQELFFGLFTGQTSDQHGWLETLPTKESAVHGQSAVSV
ncbi:MAG: branched-chain amino acid transaminase [Pseudomonadota bacterium]